MPPVTASRNRSHGRSANAERTGYGCVAGGTEKCSDHTNLLGGENRPWMTLTDQARNSTPPFGGHVGHVVGVRTEEQVGWVDAGRVVAAMTYLGLRRDRAIRALPRHAVGVQRPAPRRELAVSSGSSVASPRPAFLRSSSARHARHLGFKRNRSAVDGASHRAVLGGRPSLRWPSRQEFTTTRRTGRRDGRSERHVSIVAGRYDGA